MEQSGFMSVLTNAAYFSASFPSFPAVIAAEPTLNSTLAGAVQTVGLKTLKFKNNNLINGAVI